MKKLEHGLVTFSYLVLEIGLVASRSDLNSFLESKVLLLKRVEDDSFRRGMTKPGTECSRVLLSTACG